MSNEQPKESMDREIWRRVAGDFYSPSIFVTNQNGIGLDVGGHVIIRSIEHWHDLGIQNVELRFRAEKAHAALSESEAKTKLHDEARIKAEGRMFEALAAVKEKQDAE